MSDNEQMRRGYGPPIHILRPPRERRPEAYRRMSQSLSIATRAKTVAVSLHLPPWCKDGTEMPNLMERE